MNNNHIALCLVLAVSVAAAACAPAEKHGDGGTMRQGSAIDAGNGLKLTCDFDKKPAIGTVIVRVRADDGRGNVVTDLDIAGSSGMPDMPGAHDSGDVPFKKNQKGLYLLPVHVVMPGLWEVTITVSRDNKRLYRGKMRFNV